MGDSEDEQSLGVGLTLEVRLPCECPLFGYTGNIIMANRHVVDDRCRSEFVIRTEDPLENVICRTPTHSHDTLCVCHTFYDHGAIPTFDRVCEGCLTITAYLDDDVDTGALLTDLNQVSSQVDVLDVVPGGMGHPCDDRVSIGVGELTTKQRQALELAVEHEYYGNPRGADLQTMADELDVSRQALAHRLRAAEGKIFDQLFADRRGNSTVT